MVNLASSMLHVLVQAWHVKELAARHGGLRGALADVLRLGPHLHNAPADDNPAGPPPEHTSVVDFLHASSKPPPESWPVATIKFIDAAANK